MYNYTKYYKILNNYERRNKMNEFIEKNRPLLHSYCVGARIIGWLLLVIALVMAVEKSFSGFSDINEKFRFLMIYRLCEQLALSFVLLGLVLLGLAQFVRYLSENDYLPGWIFRHADKILYLYVAALIISPILHQYFYMKATRYAGTVNLFLYLLSPILPAVAKGLIFIGIAQILRRIKPIIEESKTLV